MLILPRHGDLSLSKAVKWAHFSFTPVPTKPPCNGKYMAFHSSFISSFPILLAECLRENHLTSLSLGLVVKWEGDYQLLLA